MTQRLPTREHEVTLVDRERRAELKVFLIAKPRHLNSGCGQFDKGNDRIAAFQGGVT